MFVAVSLCVVCFVVVSDWLHPIRLFYFHAKAVKFVVVTLVIVGTRFSCSGKFLSEVVMTASIPEISRSQRGKKKGSDSSGCGH